MPATTAANRGRSVRRASIRVMLWGCTLTPTVLARFWSPQASAPPPGLNAQVHHSLDAGRSWHRLSSDILPSGYDRVPVILFTEDSAWLATDKGQVFKTDLPLIDGK